MAHKFFKIVEITKDEYINKTNDVTAAMFSQSVNPEDDGVYVALDVDEEYELCVDVDSFVNLEPVGGNQHAD